MLKAPVIATLVGQAETELEVRRHPRAGFIGIIISHLLDPNAEVASKLVDFVAPDALDRRREQLLVLLGNSVECGVDDVGRHDHTLPRHRKHARFPHLTIELSLGAMKQAATRQRVESHERLRLLARLETANRREQELIRTGRKSL